MKKNVQMFDENLDFELTDEVLAIYARLAEIEDASEKNQNKLTTDNFRERIVEKLLRQSELMSGICHVDGRHGADSQSDAYKYIEQKSRNVSHLNKDGIAYTLSTAGFMFDKFNNDDKVNKIKLIDCMIFSVFYRKYCPINVFILSDSGCSKIKAQLLGPLYQQKIKEFAKNKKEGKAGNDAARFSVLDMFEWCPDDADFSNIITYPANNFTSKNISIKNLIVGEEEYTRTQFFDAFMKNSKTYKNRNK